MGRRYRTKSSGQFGKKDGAWLNFWLLISTIFVLLFFVFARSNTITNPVSAIISLIGLICLPISFFLFIVSIIGNTWNKGLPDISKVYKRKDKIKVNPSFNPLLGFEKCSPQFQEYMRKEIKSGRVKPKTEPQGNFNERS